MIKLYFKQAWNLIRQEHLFSTIYIVGTGLSISMVMVLSIVYYIKLSDIYPETNRSRTLIAQNGLIEYLDKPGAHSNSYLSLKVINTCFGSLNGLEAIGLELDDNTDFFIQPQGTTEQLPVSVKYVNTDFWKVFSFRFTDGRPFSEADQQSALPTVVLAHSVARRLFGEEDAVGQYVSLNFRQYKVCGVVDDASFVTERCYAQVWMPYTLSPESGDEGWDESGSLGSYSAYLLVAEGQDIHKVKQEGEANVERYNQTLSGSNYRFTTLGQPDLHWQSVFRLWERSAPDYPKMIGGYLLIFLILLLVPAVSLSGMTDSRMERRLAEMGVRRAFGAPVGSLMRQILSENFFFTLLGGLLGLLFSYLILYLTRDWIMQIGGSFIDIVPEGTDVVFTPSMLMNYQVFGIALVLCFVLNLFSALIPAWRASRRQIIYSLNVK